MSRGARSASARVALGGIAVCVALTLPASLASAKDYGRIGEAWSIAEPDLLSVIRERLMRAQQSGKLDAMNKQFAAQAESRARRPKPVEGISPATETRTWQFDPAVTIGEDIRDSKGNLVAAKGEKFNPLDRIGMRHQLAFVNGDSADEVAWAMKQGDADKVWVVFVNGSPFDRMKEFNRRFFFDQSGTLTGKFGIEHTPALVVQHGNQLDISEVAIKRGAGA